MLAVLVMLAVVFAGGVAVGKHSGRRFEGQGRTRGSLYRQESSRTQSPQFGMMHRGYVQNGYGLPTGCGGYQPQQQVIPGVPGYQQGQSNALPQSSVPPSFFPPAP